VVAAAGFAAVRVPVAEDLVVAGPLDLVGDVFAVALFKGVVRVVERGCRAAGGLAAAVLEVPLVSGLAGVRVVDGAAFVLTSPLTAGLVVAVLAGRLVALGVLVSATFRVAALVEVDLVVVVLEVVVRVVEAADLAEAVLVVVAVVVVLVAPCSEDAVFFATVVAVVRAARDVVFLATVDVVAGTAGFDAAGLAAATLGTAGLVAAGLGAAAFGAGAVAGVAFLSGDSFVGLAGLTSAVLSSMF